MYIDKFWAGVLLTIIIEIVIFMIIAYVNYRRFEEEAWEEEDDAGNSRKPD